MSQILLNAEHIADVNIKDFADFSRFGKEQEAVIKVNHNTFTVKILEDGDVNVSFKGGRFNLFRGHTKTRLRDQIRSQVDAWRNAATQPSKDAIKTAIAGKTQEALSKVFPYAPGTEDIDAGGTEVAVYGFSGIRTDNYDSAVSHNITHVTIDRYNQGIGVLYGSVGLSSIQDILSGIQNGTIQRNPGQSGIPDEKLMAWVQFLKRDENFAKINIFGRLNEYINIGDRPSTADMNLTGWKGEFARKGTQEAMEAFVRKNVSGSSANAIDGSYITPLAQVLTSIARAGTLNEQSIMSALETAAEKTGSDPSKLFLALNDIVQCAFFRQTSKLGLDFFKERGTPVMFYWTNHQGLAMPDTNRALTDKWWHNPHADITEHYGANITFSEMRHVMKMQKSTAGTPLTLAKVEGMEIGALRV